jgi:hypothetical protein
VEVGVLLGDVPPVQGDDFAAAHALVGGEPKPQPVGHRRAEDEAQLVVGGRPGYALGYPGGRKVDSGVEVEQVGGDGPAEEGPGDGEALVDGGLRPVGPEDPHLEFFFAGPVEVGG